MTTDKEPGSLAPSNMYKSKSGGAPSDGQAREKLALYVYEYLLHVGAQKAAQTFLNEIRWEKNITLGEPPGFLHSWWCVFWDLYCAAPERRETCDHSSEAKAFHDYGFVNSGYGSNGIPHNSPLRPSPPNHSPGTPGPPMMGPGPGFPPMGPRYGGPPRGPPGMMRPIMGPGGEPFNGHPGDGDFFPMQGPPGMGPRMTPPRGPGGPMGPMGPGGPMYGPMRGPPPGGPMPPMSSMGPGGPRPPWPPSSMSPYGGGSPGYVGPPPGGPGTPIMPSPGPGPDNDPLYMMKNVPSSLPGPGDSGGMTPGPGNNNTGDNGVNGDTLENMKQSPGTAPNTPRDAGAGSEPPMDFNMTNFAPPGNSNESEAILKIKESMQEEAKRFEKDSDGGGGGGGGSGGGSGPGSGGPPPPAAGGAGQGDFFMP